MKKKIVAIIPARSGSKGIIGKNLIDFCGSPLLTWTIKAAQNSGVIDRIIVSTDSDDIAEVARNAGAETPFIRPLELAKDEVHAVGVILHALDWLRLNEHSEPYGIMMLLPTSPLRQAEDICGAVKLFEERSADAVVSVVDLGKYMTNLRFMDGDKLKVVSPSENRNAQRQDLEKLFGVNGSIFLARPSILKEKGTFHVDEALGYIMEPLNSIDINSENDLMLARKIRVVIDSQ
jgi:CMP-N,N'-diacetyllegionaminic acid synthase